MVEPPQLASSRRASILRRIFLSPDEPRLRSGWRLLIHTALLLLIYLALSLLALTLLGPDLLYPARLQGLWLGLELIAILAATWLARRLLDRRSFLSLGLRPDRHTASDLTLGFLLPALMMGLIFLFELAVGWLKIEGWAWRALGSADAMRGVLDGLLLFILVGIAEEVLSRGYHLQNLAEGLNLHWALLISSGVFALLHLANPGSSWHSTLGLLAAGYFLAYGWIVTRQLWLPIGLHIGWNFFEGTVFGFPVSGLNTFRLIETSVSGPELVTGGAFGPEAGLIVLPAMLLGAWIMRVYGRRRRSHLQKMPESPGQSDASGE